MPAPKKGMSIWAKIGMGCGAALLLVALLCGSCVFLVGKKFSSNVEASWSLLYSTAEALKTDEGVRQLYGANPGLKENYPTEDEFVSAAQEWRSKLGPVPRQCPDLKTMFSNNLVEYNVRSVNRHQTVVIRYRTSPQGRLSLESEDGKLVDVRVE